MKRRDIFKLGAVAAIGAVTTGCATATSAGKNKSGAMGSMSYSMDAMNLPKNGNGKKIVVVGGGWSGLSIAKRLKENVPSANVILVDQRAHFVSCPLSNLWLVDKVELDFLTHSFLDAAKNNGYTFANASVGGVDRKNKVISTNQGSISYDYLVLSPGIDYDYSAWTEGDANLEYELRTNYPAGFMTHSEHQTIKEKIHNFKGGNFILTCPAGNYRCLPAPYERACLIADYFKKNKIKGKVVLLDENPDITIKKEGFHSAFNKLYKGYIDYKPSQTLVKFDLKNKVVSTDFDEFKFEDAAFYPHIRGGKLIEIAGVAQNAQTKFADIDPFTYQVKGDSSVYCAGDARPMGFSKSGNTSNTEGYVVANSIASAIKGEKFKWTSPHTTCFSAVSASTSFKAISVDADYAYNKKSKAFGFANASTDENWKKHGKSNAQGLLGWGTSMYFDMFDS